MNIIGISAYYHDSAACLVINGQIIAAAQEERFSRRKHDPRFPVNALRYCLRAGMLKPKEVDFVVFYDKPFLKFERLLETYLEHAPKGIYSFLASMPVWLKEKLFLKNLLVRELAKSFDQSKEEHSFWLERILFSEHHLSHAASAFYPSPFESAAIMTVDGVGEWATTTIGRGKGNYIDLTHEIHFPHSLGLLYSAFTYYTGFKVNSGEYKVMGLAPYGEPKYVDAILKHLIDLKEDGSFTINQEYFDYCTGLKMISPKFERLFGGPPRRSESKLMQREMDLARSIQVVTEEILARMIRHLHRETLERNLCLAGGVALNCVANGRILREGPFEHLWIQPAAGDAGGALGAALAVWHLHHGKCRVMNGQDSDIMQGAYLGPSFSEEEIETFLKSQNIPYEKLPENILIERTTDLLIEGRVVGWFQGRMEFGPRALGNRSIIGDARSAKMQSILNLKIKYRESFRPFAPSVLRDKVADYFELDEDSPYMLFVAYVQKERRIDITTERGKLWGIDLLNVPRSDIPAVTHIDYSARVQTVHEQTNPRYHRLIKRFGDKTGCYVIVNTSFNVRGEPIVCTPEDAYRCFMRTEMDNLVLGNCLLKKAAGQMSFNDTDWRREFELD